MPNTGAFTVPLHFVNIVVVLKAITHLLTNVQKWLCTTAVSIFPAYRGSITIGVLNALMGHKRFDGFLLCLIMEQSAVNKFGKHVFF